MKVTCDREALLAAFQTAAAVVPSRSPKPILQNIKLEVSESGAILLATDLEIGIRIQVPGIQVEVPGSAILPLGRFGSILRESTDDTLRLESDGQATLVRGERSEFKLPAENPQEFPTVADFTEKAYHEIPARALKETIRRTIFATDNESSRYALGGVLLEMGADKITAVGTDGRRLAKMEVPARSEGGHQSGESMTIVPTKAMQLIERALADGDAEIQIAARTNEILVRGPRATIYSRLVEGRFPKWRDVFPQRSNTARIDLTVGPLYSAVRQAAIVTSEESRGVDFNFEAGTLVLSGRVAEVGQSRVELPISYDGPTISIMLDPRYLADFLKVLDPEKVVTIEIKDAESAAVCTTDDGYGYVIMPLARSLVAAREWLRVQISSFSSESNPRVLMSHGEPRNSAPRHIGDVLSQLIARRGYARVQSAGALIEAWNVAAGERWTSCTRAMAVRRGVLEVLVGNSTLAQELGFQKKSLVKRLAELLPDEKIRDLKFRVGPLT